MARDRFSPAQPLTSDEIESLREQVTLAHEVDLRARARMALRPPGELCFALLGVSVPGEIRLGDYAVVRPIEEPPHTGSLMEVMKEKAHAAALGRWIGSCDSELALSRELADASKIDLGLKYGWIAIAALRLCSDNEFLVPGVADRSWDTVAGAQFDECWTQVLDDNPMALMLRPRSEFVLSSDQANWVTIHFEKLLELTAERRFHFALQSLSDNQSLSDLRMMTAMLWSGLEALVDVGQEIRFRIAALLATMMRPRGASRYSTYRELLKLYDVRSKAVHGATLSQAQLIEHVLAVRGVLRRCLAATLERGSVWTRDELEEELIGT